MKLYKTDGTVEDFPYDDTPEAFKRVQVAVGGFVEHVGLPDGSFLLCHEEGKLIGLPMNDKATEEFGRFLLPGDRLVGNVLHGEKGEMS